MIKIIQNIKTKIIKKLLSYIQEDIFMIEDTLIVKNFNYQNNLNESENFLILNKHVEKSIDTKHVQYSKDYLLILNPEESNGLINKDSLTVLLKNENTIEDRSRVQTNKHILLKGYIEHSQEVMENRTTLILNKRVEEPIDTKDVQYYDTKNKKIVISQKMDDIYDFIQYKKYREICDTKLIGPYKKGIQNDLVDLKYREKILENYIFEGKFVYRGLNIEFTDTRSLWILMHELLFLEEYSFTTIKKMPYIIDCGVNFGLSIAYFKSLYPECRILGFEPMPEMFNLSQKNVKNNGFTNVEILPYALAAQKKIEKFYISENDSMAASLYNKPKQSSAVEVQCDILSRYLDEKVDFLKMDIEGAEEEVLIEAKDQLCNVKYLFCEYHFTTPDESNRLDVILSILSDVGFVYQVDKSWGYKQKTSEQPFKYVGNKYSAIIFAKNLKFEEDK